MRSLTLWRPWDLAIARVGKRLENRPWKPPSNIIGQRIALHAGKHYHVEAGEMIAEVARLNGYGVPRFSESKPGIFATCGVLGFASSEAEADAEGQLDWWSGPFGWLLADLIVFEQRIPARGMQGLWPLDPRLEDLVVQAERAVRSRTPIATTPPPTAKSEDA